MTKNYSFTLLFLMGALLFTAAACNSQPEKPGVGDKAPLFTAKASLDGNELDISLETILEKGPAVVYFYPAAFTKGCDLEAATFARHIDEFTAANTSIIGVSADDIARLNEFSADPELCAGKFPVASDPDGKIAATYGLQITYPEREITDGRGNTVNHGMLPRVTFVIDKDGNILKTFSSQEDGLSPDEHVTEALSLVKTL